MDVHREPPHRRRRVVTLLVPVQGVSGTLYPVGTKVATSGRGSAVDGFVGGDWLPLSWWEFGEPTPEGGQGPLLAS